MSKQPVVPLTDEQRALIEKYLKDNGWSQIKTCIRKTLRKNPSQQEMEDYLGVAHEALMKAAKRFRQDKRIQFSTFVYMNVSSSIKTYLTHKRRKKRMINENTQSLSGVNTEGVSLEDILIGDEDVALKEEARIKEYMNTLPIDAQKVLKLRMAGYTVSDISYRLSLENKYIKELFKMMKSYERVKILRRR